MVERERGGRRGRRQTKERRQIDRERDGGGNEGGRNIFDFTVEMIKYKCVTME